MSLRPRLHGTGRIWDRSQIRPFSPVYTRIRPVRWSQIRPVRSVVFVCLHGQNGRILVERFRFIFSFLRRKNNYVFQF